MADPYSISALVISGLTAVGTVIVHYNFRHCKSACCESDCFNPLGEGADQRYTTVSVRNNSPIIIQEWHSTQPRPAESPQVLRRSLEAPPAPAPQQPRTFMQEIEALIEVQRLSRNNSPLIDGNMIEEDITV